MQHRYAQPAINAVQTQRIRGRTLQRLRAYHLSRDPCCAVCMAAGRVRAATDLDHIIPLFKGGTNIESNLQCLCGDCHRDKTAADMGYKVKQHTGRDGWPVNWSGT